MEQAKAIEKVLIFSVQPDFERLAHKKQKMYKFMVVSSQKSEKRFGNSALNTVISYFSCSKLKICDFWLKF